MTQFGRRLPHTTDPGLAMRAPVPLLLAVLLLVSCGSDDDGQAQDGGPDATPTPVQLFPDDFEGVCSGGTQTGAADYASSDPHKAVYFESYEDVLLDQSTRLPADWTVQFDPDSDVYATVDVVGCGLRTAEELVKKCEGYEIEETDTTGSVNWYTATYEMSAYEGKTGTQLGSATLEADDTECPMFATFEEGEDEVDMFASPTEQEVARFLKPFVRP